MTSPPTVVGKKLFAKRAMKYMTSVRQKESPNLLKSRRTCHRHAPFSRGGGGFQTQEPSNKIKENYTIYNIYWSKKQHHFHPIGNRSRNTSLFNVAHL